MLETIIFRVFGSNYKEREEPAEICAAVKRVFGYEKLAPKVYGKLEVDSETCYYVDFKLDIDSERPAYCYAEDLADQGGVKYVVVFGLEGMYHGFTTHFAGPYEVGQQPFIKANVEDMAKLMKNNIDKSAATAVEDL